MRASLQAVTAIVVLATALSGCAAQEAEQPESAKDTPSFSGPWASVFAHEYEATTSDFARQVLADGKITEAERAAVIERFSDCLTQNGLTLKEYRVDGSFQIDINDRAEEDDPSKAKMPGCRDTSGINTIDLLYQDMRKNPENRNKSEIMVECLLKAEAVSEGYTVADFDREDPSGKVTLLRPELKETAKDPVLLCEKDPLGILSGTG